VFLESTLCYQECNALAGKHFGHGILPLQGLAGAFVAATWRKSYRLNLEV
jgi:hypothetical protein